MSVPAEVSLQAVQAELVHLEPYAEAAGVVLDISTLEAQNLRFYATFENLDCELFNVEFDCQEYPLHPPTVEFVSEDRLECGMKHLYPNGFHAAPCVCMRYNRKAYSERGGPHGDWRLLDWRLPTTNGAAIDSLALMVSDLNSKIRESSGRMS